MEVEGEFTWDESLNDGSMIFQANVVEGVNITAITKESLPEPGDNSQIVIDMLVPNLYTTSLVGFVQIG